MLTYVYSVRCVGIQAIPVTVEVDITAGIGIHLVGLADTAVKESLLRTVSALQFLDYRIPGKKIIINLAPADIRKQGSLYDVPIAMGIIAASGQEDLPDVDKYLMMGELGLDGSVRKVPGALPAVEMARDMGFKGCIFPLESALETAEFEGIDVYGVRTLTDVIRIVAHEPCEDMLIRNIDWKSLDLGQGQDEWGEVPDFAEIIGQEGAKRGLEIAAAGGHNVIMIGPPGSGKSSMAKALAGILPPMTAQEAIQTSKIYSVAGKGRSACGLIWKRPFRAPHHSTSLPAIIGGGSEYIMPGEVSLAHNGVLFVDEFLEAPKRIIEALRGPVEDRKVTISRLRTKVEFPASFMLVAATNPCPCGYYGEGDRCTCSPGRRASYMAKLSGPLMDRIDLHLWLRAVDTRKLVERERAESSAEIAARVAAAREIQKDRFAGEEIFCNAEMPMRLINEYCALDGEGKDFLELLIENMGFSARACSKILKIARTVADLEGAGDIRLEHISEAAGFRFLDKKDPGI